MKNRKTKSMGLVAWLGVVSAPVGGLAQPSPEPAEESAPQANASLSVGPVISSGQDGGFADHAELELGLRGDILFLRAGPEDFGLGPYLEASTFAVW